jgi:hypothetical protein
MEAAGTCLQRSLRVFEFLGSLLLGSFLCVAPVLASGCLGAFGWGSRCFHMCAFTQKKLGYRYMLHIFTCAPVCMMLDMPSRP